MEVIISDIDGTLVCVDSRINFSYQESGGKRNRKFWEVFRSDKYTSFDTPIWTTLYELHGVYKSTELPVILVSGRSEKMKKGNAFVRKLLENIGIKVTEEIYKNGVHTRTSKFKLDEVKKRGYYPAYLFEDDEEIANKFMEVYDECIVYFVEECSKVTIWE